MKKVLIVEDENNLLKLYDMEFNDAGFEVHGCSTKAETLEYLKNNNPDIIILDIKLPDNKGSELLLKIKEVKNEIPVIIYTAYTNLRHDRNFWAADDFVIKSGDIFELITKVKTKLL
ncbi:MAG: response regulator [Candidatus Hydrogenedentota bacterium]